MNYSALSDVYGKKHIINYADLCGDKNNDSVHLRNRWSDYLDNKNYDLTLTNTDSLSEIKDHKNGIYNYTADYDLYAKDNILDDTSEIYKHNPSLNSLTYDSYLSTIEPHSKYDYHKIIDSTRRANGLNRKRRNDISIDNSEFINGDGHINENINGNINGNINRNNVKIEIEKLINERIHSISKLIMSGKTNNSIQWKELAILSGAFITMILLILIIYKCCLS